MAAEISAQLVRELREKTGTGMMDCKRALQETNGDIEAAVVLLREKGMASAAKRADRATTEGRVGYSLANGLGNIATGYVTIYSTGPMTPGNGAPTAVAIPPQVNLDHDVPTGVSVAGRPPSFKASMLNA